MLQAAAAVHTLLDSPCRQVISLIEARYGRDVITGGYVKMHGLLKYCEKQAADNTLALPAALLFVFEGMLYDLDWKVRTPRSFTNEALHAGWLSATLAKMWLQQHIAGIVEDMANLTPQPPLLPELRQVVSWFDSWASFQTTFPKPAAAPDAPAAPAAEREAASAEVCRARNAAAQELFRRLSKVGMLVAELLYSAYAGYADTHIRFTTLTSLSINLDSLFSKGGFTR